MIENPYQPPTSMSQKIKGVRENQRGQASLNQRGQASLMGVGGCESAGDHGVR